MLSSILGEKIKQMQMFTDSGKRIPVTVISVGPCWITAMDIPETHAWMQLGFGAKKYINKPVAGHIKKAGIQEKPRFLRQVKVKDFGEWKVGDTIAPDTIFTPGDSVRVTGISKGKGFAGVMKRHGFHGGPATHGQSDRARAPGSIGQTTTPGRVYRGKRMAGRMGGDRVTVKGLSVIAVDAERKILMIKGLIPGGKHGLVIIQKEQ